MNKKNKYTRAVSLVRRMLSVFFTSNAIVASSSWFHITTTVVVVGTRGWNVVVVNGEQ